jgi:hypothetical protein
MQTKSATERRRGKRIRLLFRVEVSGIDIDGNPYSALAAASDVSDRGCQVHLKRQVRSGDTITLRVLRHKDSATDNEAPFVYQVVWAKLDDGFWVAGLEALEPGNPWLITFPQSSLARD